MSAIVCDRKNCKHNEPSQYREGTNFSRRGGGYNYGGGDIMISKYGYCKCFEKKPKPNLIKEANK